MDSPVATIDPAAPAPAPSTLAAYLAEHDAPCPRCRYNLRGVTTTTCPECGGAISLGLASASRFGGRGLYILALLLVVLVGAVFAGVRQWREVRSAASAGSFVFSTTAPLRVYATSGQTVVVAPTPSAAPTPAPTSSNSIGSVTISAPTLTFSPSGSVNSASAAATLRSRLTTRSSAAPFAIPAVPMPTNWAGVTIGQWSLLGVWAAFLLASISALVMLLVVRLRRSNPSPRWVRAVSNASIALVALFGAAHITLFLVDALH